MWVYHNLETNEETIITDSRITEQLDRVLSKARNKEAIGEHDLYAGYKIGHHKMKKSSDTGNKSSTNNELEFI